MSEQDKKLVPKLRFPEFVKYEAWGQKTLEEMSVPINEKIGNKNLIPVSISAGVGFVTQVEKFGRDISGNQYSLYTHVKKGDFVYNKGNSLKFPQGCVYELRDWEEVAAPSVFISFRLKSEYLNAFYQYCFEKNIHGIQLKKDITSGARSNGLLNISKEVFFKIKLPILNFKEQEKIANCLSSLDNLITAQNQKVEALKQHKKGLMQQLFPAESETVPKLRFPEFQDADDWEEKPLKDVFSIFQGFAFSSSDAVNHGVRWLKIADVSFQKMNHDSPSYLPIRYKEKYDKFLVKSGDYVMALTRPILSKQLKIAQVDVEFDGALLNQRVGKLESNHNLSFVYCLLQTTKLIEQIEKSISGSEPPNLSTQQIEDLKVYIPLDRDEQKKVAYCLVSIDEHIAAQIQQMEAYKTYKKGLMQQLFPIINEVSE